ncbi:MAG: BspA family leucine-rich repeat surface protein [Bacilli bacterium]|nr:BspA family leucine-rich repeat surface protein [Bacilli bacterium]
MGVICKYKYDSSIYADLIPEFNSGYSGYTITDEVEGNIITRTIESDELPTMIRFGSTLDTYVKGKEVSLLEVLEIDTSELTNCYRMFRYCKNLTSITCEWNTTKVFRMDAMFYNCSNLTSLDVSDFDTTNVTAMNNMFYNCSNLTSLDVSGFDTSNVSQMYNMFQKCSKLTSLNVSGFNTTKVTSMNSMFNGCSSLTSLDLSSFNTTNVTSIYTMFYNCSKLTNLDLSSFDTTNVTNMDSIFANCASLTNLDLSNFDTSNVTKMPYMFQNCSKLTLLDLSNFDTTNVTNTTNMFVNTNSLEVITMFNNDINTINVVGNLTSATIYVDESLDQSQYTGTAPLKVYKEEKLEIKLNSPLLEEDTIEIVDGKICHVHRMGKVVFDGSEDWKTGKQSNNYYSYILHDVNYSRNIPIICSTIITQPYSYYIHNVDEVYIATGESSADIGRLVISYTIQSLDEFKQWLSENPVTAIYKLKTPYYEDITPLQSSITLKTFLESSMTIDTDLPIETKLSYRTNVPSISTLSTRATELAESDNVIHNLMNIIDDEVDE